MTSWVLKMHALVEEGDKTQLEAAEVLSAELGKSLGAVRKAYSRWRKQQKDTGAALVHGNSKLGGDVERTLSLSLQVRAEAGHAVRAKPSSVERIITTTTGVSVSNGFGKRFLARHADELSQRQSKARTAGRTLMDSCLTAAELWAPKYEAMLDGTAGGMLGVRDGGRRIGDSQLGNMDPTHYFVEPDGTQLRIFSKGATRVTHVALSRPKVASIAPVMLADGTVLCVFVCQAASFGKTANVPNSAALVSLNVPVLVPNTRSTGCPVYYCYTDKGYFTGEAMSAALAITHYEWTLRHSVTSEVYTMDDLVTGKVKSSRRFVLTMDNASVNHQPDTIVQLAFRGMDVMFGPANLTHLWQASDAYAHAYCKREFRESEQVLSDAYALVATSGNNAGLRAALVAAAVDITKSMSKSTIVESFRATKTLPSEYIPEAFVHMVYGAYGMKPGDVKVPDVVEDAKRMVAAAFFKAEKTVSDAEANLMKGTAVVVKSHLYTAADLHAHMQHTADVARQQKDERIRKEAEKKESKRKRNEEAAAAAAARAEKEQRMRCSGVGCTKVSQGGAMWLSCACEISLLLCPVCKSNPAAMAAYAKHVADVHAAPVLAKKRKFVAHAQAPISAAAAPVVTVAPAAMDHDDAASHLSFVKAKRGANKRQLRVTTKYNN